VPPPASPAQRASERDALLYIMIGALMLLVGAAASLVVSLGGTLGLDVVTTSSSGVGVSFTGLFLAIALASVLVELIVVFLTYTAFHRLAAFDPRFSMPAKLAFLLGIAVVIIAALLYPLLEQLNSTITCLNNASNSTITPGASPATCISGALAGLIGLLIIAGILALIGYIGLLIGIWRLGHRYDDGLFKAGAILAIFPLLNLIGAILIAVAAHNARSKLDAGGTPMSYRPG
jgi:hypothetical protein